MAKHRTHSIEFKRQVVQDYLGGETLYGLGKRHEISRTLIRVWLAKHEAGVLDSDTAAADMLADYEARIAALERSAQHYRRTQDGRYRVVRGLQHDRRWRPVGDRRHGGWHFRDHRHPRHGIALRS